MSSLKGPAWGSMRVTIGFLPVKGLQVLLSGVLEGFYLKGYIP